MMKEKLQWKRLVIYLATAGILAFLSRLLMVEKSWKTVMIATVLAFLIYPVISSVFPKEKRGMFNSSRVALIILALVAGYLYNRAWNNHVCTVEVVTMNGQKSSIAKRNIITGHKLNDESDAVLNKLQEERKYNELINILQTHEARDIWTEDSIEDNRRKLNVYLIALTILVSLLAMHTVETFLFRAGTEGPLQQVFISYNHENKAEAARLAGLLRDNQINVIRDEDNMMAGEDINVFIKNAIKTSCVTLLVVSEKSLLSGWVATEALTSYFLSDFDTRRACIACYIDTGFLAPGFGNRALVIIQQRLEAIQKEIQERDALQTDSKELNDQKTRLHRLKANLDTILQRLQNSKSIPIGNGQLEENFPRILQAIKEKFRESN